MNSQIPSDLRLSERLLTLTVTASAAGLVVFSLFVSASLSLNDLAILSASSVVAVFVSGFSFSVPGTRIRIFPSTIISLWGAMWLGVPGAVLLASVSGIADKIRSDENDRPSIFSMACNIHAGFAAAHIYLLALENFRTEVSAFAAVVPSIPNEVMIAAVLMAGVHFCVVESMRLIRRMWASSGALQPTRDDEMVVIASSYPASLLGALLLFLAMSHFGVEFGLVLVPLAFLGNFAYGIHKRSLQQKTREITEASRLHLATVEALATAIDARDQVGRGHVRRTQMYAVGLGRVLGLSDDQIRALRTGALLHDIGKLAVPDHILNKPGRLTPAEMEKSKIHASVGASILEEVGFTYPVVPTVRHHHECWDGSGYPEGLKGQKIPITARIITIADAFDSLRGERPYRRAVSREEACEFLRSRAGTQFDPALVDAFIRNLKVFEEEIESNGLGYESSDNKRNRQDKLPDYIEQIQSANHEVFSLFSLAREVSSSLNLGETLEYFTEKVADFVPYDKCVVYLVEDSGEFARAAYIAGKHSKNLAGNRLRLGEGTTGKVLKERTTVVNADPALDLELQNFDDWADFKTMASLPLITENKVIGAISLYSSSVDAYLDEHIRLVDTISRIAADAIEKALRHTEAQVYALTDPMTGLPNARSLFLEFEKEVTRASRNGNTFQLLVLDLDGFKSVNDNFGHKTGDDLLREVARLIRSQLREYDFLARYGGDEFVAIVPETDMAFVEALRHRIEDTVSSFRMVMGSGKYARVGISIGSASFPSHGEKFEELIVAADKAMYRNKAINRLRRTQIENSVTYDDDVIVIDPHTFDPVDSDLEVSSETFEENPSHEAPDDTMPASISTVQ